MKASRYNHFIPYSETNSIAYNALSNALALIENVKLEEYYRFVNDDIEFTDKKLCQDFIHGSFLIEDDMVDELDVVRHNMLRGRYATNTLGLTITPTMDCNFQCVYCFEKEIEKNCYMSDIVQDAIVKILEKHTPYIQALTVNWYGGEPLLAMSVIEKLSKRFIEICANKNISYSANLITNGYLLTYETLELLRKLKIEFIQVTLDGGPKHHNIKRPLKGGGDTFWKILNNLRDGYDLLPRVALRINVDQDNISAGDEISCYLKEYGLMDKVKPYFGRIRNDNECYHDEKCINACDFAYMEYEYNVEMEQSRFSGLDKIYYPISKSSFCCADRSCSYVIAADGLLYKCWSDVGNIKKSTGNILEPFNDLNSVYLKYMLFDPTKILPCKECNILPICMGGCPFQRIERGTQQCLSEKYILERCLKDAVEKLQKK